MRRQIGLSWQGENVTRCTNHRPFRRAGSRSRTAGLAMFVFTGGYALGRGLTRT